ncbi:MAG: alpha/beta hydrolase-fold protein [Gemmatimonadota bacterium]|nr:alpha/beta hydrolase-fold protein [Gemmatimonadota bacterium]MDH3424445.1 alpha/beta hydrolase-fold protein [Gemmatimonadota bacterium]
MKKTDSWYSQRLECDVTVARWGEIGTPFLIFPTAGGDAEEIERFLVIDTLREYLEEGLIKVYSCDSIAGRAMLRGDGTPQYRMWLWDQFLEFVGKEVVPAIRTDCRSQDIGIMVAGSSIGALNALASICRFPESFTHALCMSGTYDLQRFLKAPITRDFYHASPVHHLADLEGPRLEKLRERFVLLASGEGEAEDIGESWRVADLLGSKGIPNRVDSWGPDWKHDWPLWRNMLHKYTPGMAGAEASS